MAKTTTPGAKYNLYIVVDQFNRMAVPHKIFKTQTEAKLFISQHYLSYKHKIVKAVVTWGTPTD